MKKRKCELGIIGLGVIGRNLLLNIAEHGYSVAGFDRDCSKVEALKKESKAQNVQGFESLAEFVTCLRAPRMVLMLVPAGKPVDEAIQEIMPVLKRGDLIADCGNSHYRDTDRRLKDLMKKGIHFLGVGISGGEAGARLGPSLMAGGSPEAYGRIQTVFESVAAQVKKKPCAAHLGRGLAGHYVKMVHNGIEYAVMQLISETYDLMKRGLGLNNNELCDVYERWNQGELRSFLLEITSRIFRKPDDKKEGWLIDQILDQASQKGTGKWTSQEAMDLKVPIPTIDAAVSMRALSSCKKERVSIARTVSESRPAFESDRRAFLETLRNGYYFSAVVTYAQGMALIRAASEAYKYQIRLDEVLRVWQGGCIIRSALLSKLRSAFLCRPDLPNLILDSEVARLILAREQAMREVVQRAVKLRIPMPGFMASLAYYEACRSARLPANLIQAQRDYFGAHTYERSDMAGTFHTSWDGKKKRPRKLVAARSK